MKTLVVDKDGKLSIRETLMPEYNECQALVKTLSCGICNGTDSKLIHHNFKGFGADRYPLMLGHEAVGRVIETGSKVTGFKVGDIVLLPFAAPNRELDSGWGAFSEYGVVCDPAAYMANGVCPGTPEFPECAFAQQVVPEFIDPVEAPVIITLREVLSSIKRFGIKENDSIAVFGCGPVGLTFVKFMHILGVNPIIAFDIVDEKIEDAMAMGADYAYNSKDADIVEKVREICPDGVKYVLDAVGLSQIINQAMPLIADQGKICCYGISSNSSMNLDWSQAPYNWQLHFQQFPSKYEESLAHNQVIAWIEDGIINLRDFISDIIHFDNILDAFDKLEKKEIAKKCIIRYE
ncbi:MAG TPA: zinc-binding dehydrogenase [Clostridiales bacterium]|nr:zinc-binding dehydrogenase [Clostridiales bacterium]